MSHFNLVDIIFFTLLIICHSQETHKSFYSKQKTRWVNQSQKSIWPEHLFKQTYPQNSLRQQNIQKNVLPKKLQLPKWPEEVEQKNTTKELQNYVSWSSLTTKSFSFQTHLTPKLEGLIEQRPKPALSTPKYRIGESHIRRTKILLKDELQNMKQNSLLEPKELYHSKHEEQSTKDIIKASMVSNDPEIQEGMCNMLDIFTMNLDFLPNNNINLDTNVRDDDDADITPPKSSSFYTIKNMRRGFYEKYTKFPRRFTRLYNDTINVKDRTFRYQICDRRYLRNVCQFAIIYAFHTICERYNCSHSVIPRVWDVTKKKCDDLIKKKHPNPVWNGTFQYFRNNRLSPVDRWPMWNGAPQPELSESLSYDSDVVLREGKDNKKQRKGTNKSPNKGIPVGRKRLLGKKVTGFQKKKSSSRRSTIQSPTQKNKEKKRKNGSKGRKKGYYRPRIIKNTRKKYG